MTGRGLGFYKKNEYCTGCCKQTILEAHNYTRLHLTSPIENMLQVLWDLLWHRAPKLATFLSPTNKKAPRKRGAFAQAQLLY